MVKKDDLFSTEGVTKSDRSLHTPGSFAKQNLLYVQEVGKLKSLRPHRCVRENLDSFLFMMVLSGKGTVECRNKKYEMAAGDCAFIHCMEHYEHISDEEDGWELAWVHFNGLSARAYFELFEKYNKENLCFHVSAEEQLLHVVEELQRYQKERSFKAELACGEILLRLVNTILENVMSLEEAGKEDARVLASQIREYINDIYYRSNIPGLLTAKFELEEACMNEMFQNHFGISLEEYVWSRRFNAAKEMLRFSVKPVEEVSRETGMASVSVLQNLFMEKEGMSAEEYRMKWAQWIK